MPVEDHEFIWGWRERERDYAVGANVLSRILYVSYRILYQMLTRDGFLNFLEHYFFHLTTAFTVLTQTLASVGYDRTYKILDRTFVSAC